MLRKELIATKQKLAVLEKELAATKQKLALSENTNAEIFNMLKVVLADMNKIIQANNIDIMLEINKQMAVINSIIAKEKLKTVNTVSIKPKTNNRKKVLTKQ